MDWQTIAVVYAAALSTVVFCWRLYEYFEDKKGNISVRLLTATKKDVLKYHYPDNLDFHLIALITNRGRNHRHIKVPGIRSKPEKTAVTIFESLTLINMSKNDYPKKLEPGEEVQYVLPGWYLYAIYKKGVKRISLSVADTHGKVYHSGWITL